MATMTHRTTFALDEATVNRIRALAEQWQVSQAEVIRRAIAQTASTVTPDAIALLDALHRDRGGLSPADASSYLETVRADRASWRGS